MQVRIRKQMAIRYSKVDVMEIYWNKVIGMILMSQKKVKDNKGVVSKKDEKIA
jgi:hypothetical protein